MIWITMIVPLRGNFESYKYRSMEIQQNNLDSSEYRWLWRCEQLWELFYG